MKLKRYSMESDTTYAIRCEVNRLRRAGNDTINWRMTSGHGQLVTVEFEDFRLSKRMITKPVTDWMPLEALLAHLKTLG